jgi:hypothetical protein
VKERRLRRHGPFRRGNLRGADVLYEPSRASSCVPIGGAAVTNTVRERDIANVRAYVAHPFAAARSACARPARRLDAKRAPRRVARDAG